MHFGEVLGAQWGQLPASLGARPTGRPPQWPHSTPGAVGKVVFSAQDMGLFGVFLGDTGWGLLSKAGEGAGSPGFPGDNPDHIGHSSGGPFFRS